MTEHENLIFELLILSVVNQMIRFVVIKTLQPELGPTKGNGV